MGQVNWLDKFADWGWAAILAAVALFGKYVHGKAGEISDNKKDISELRLYLMDNYVKKEDFEGIVDELKAEIRGGNEKIMQLLINQAKRR